MNLVAIVALALNVASAMQDDHHKKRIIRRQAEEDTLAVEMDAEGKVVNQIQGYPFSGGGIEAYSLSSSEDESRSSSAYDDIRTGTTDSGVFIGGKYIELGFSTVSSDTQGIGNMAVGGEPPANFHGRRIRTDENNKKIKLQGIGMLNNAAGFKSKDDLSNQLFTIDDVLPEDGPQEEGFYLGYEDASGKKHTRKNCGSKVTARTAGSRAIADVEAALGANDELKAYIQTTLSKNDKFFRTDVRVENSGTETMNKVRYMRALNPESTVDSGPGGKRNTKNERTEGDSGGNTIEVVSASSIPGDEFSKAGLGAVARIAFYSKRNDKVTVVASAGEKQQDGSAKESPGSPFDASVYDTPTLQYDGDSFISINFNAQTLAPGHTIHFTYFTSMGTDPVSSVLSGFTDAHWSIGFCDDHGCPATHVKKDPMPVSCEGDACQVHECCDVKATCAAYDCTKTGDNVIKTHPLPEDIKCESSKCVEKEDHKDATHCCEMACPSFEPKDCPNRTSNECRVYDGECDISCESQKVEVCSNATDDEPCVVENDQCLSKASCNDDYKCNSGRVVQSEFELFCKGTTCEESECCGVPDKCSDQDAATFCSDDFTMKSNPPALCGKTVCTTEECCEEETGLLLSQVEEDEEVDHNDVMSWMPSMMKEGFNTMFKTGEHTEVQHKEKEDLEGMDHFHGLFKFGEQMEKAFEKEDKAVWTPSGNNNWCRQSNKDEWTQSTSSDGGWKLDTHRNGGWRWCGITVEKCQSECLDMLGCVQIYYTPNRCCFPAKTACSGYDRPGGRGGTTYKNTKAVAQGVNGPRVIDHTVDFTKARAGNTTGGVFVGGKYIELGIRRAAVYSHTTAKSAAAYAAKKGYNDLEYGGIGSFGAYDNPVGFHGRKPGPVSHSCVNWLDRKPYWKWWCYTNNWRGWGFLSRRKRKKHWDQGPARHGIGMLTNPLGFDTTSTGDNMDATLEWNLAAFPTEGFHIGYKGKPVDLELNGEIKRRRRWTERSSKTETTCMNCAEGQEIKSWVDDTLQEAYAEVIARRGHLKVTMLITLKASEKFYRTDVTLENNGTETIEDVRYMRAGNFWGTYEQGGVWWKFVRTHHPQGGGWAPGTKAVIAESKVVKKCKYWWWWCTKDLYYQKMKQTAKLIFYTKDPKAEVSYGRRWWEHGWLEPKSIFMDRVHAAPPAIGDKGRSTGMWMSITRKEETLAPGASAKFEYWTAMTSEHAEIALQHIRAASITKGYCIDFLQSPGCSTGWVDKVDLDLPVSCHRDPCIKEECCNKKETCEHLDCSTFGTWEQKRGGGHKQTNSALCAGKDCDATAGSVDRGTCCVETCSSKVTDECENDNAQRGDKNTCKAYAGACRPACAIMGKGECRSIIDQNGKMHGRDDLLGETEDAVAAPNQVSAPSSYCSWENERLAPVLVQVPPGRHHGAGRRKIGGECLEKGQCLSTFPCPAGQALLPEFPLFCADSTCTSEDCCGVFDVCPELEDGTDPNTLQQTLFSPKCSESEWWEPQDNTAGTKVCAGVECAVQECCCIRPYNDRCLDSSRVDGKCPEIESMGVGAQHCIT